MKTRCTHGLLVAGLSLLASASTQAQTTLSAGGIVFSGYDSRGSTPSAEWFSFILTQPIAAGTSIKFTDRGYFSSSSTYNSAVANTEGTTLWTSGSPLPTGTEITISNGSAYLNGSTTTTNGTVNTGYDAGGLVNLGLGDQIIAFQGNADIAATGVNAPTLLAGLHFNRCTIGSTLYTTQATWDPSGNCTNGNAVSQLPPGLTAGTNAIWMDQIGTNLVSTGVYNCANNPTPHSPTNFRSSIANYANWTRTTGGSVSAPTGSACGRTYYATLLPVTWLSFNGTCNVGATALEWTVGDEKAVTGYNVERSANGDDFETIGTVVAKGEAGTLAYRFTDRNLGAAAHYFYRLKTQAIDGNPQYSSTVRVANSNAAAADIRLLHNPAGASLDLEITAAADGMASIVVTDLVGKVILRQDWPVHAGRQTVSCPATSLQADQLYLLTGRADGKVWTSKVVR